MIKPITRKEKLLSAIANDAPVTIQPKTREELFFAQIAEKTSNVPKPIPYDYMPEGYPKKSGVDVITWDGNTEGLVSATDEYGDAYYKMSDAVLTLDELVGVTIKIREDGSVREVKLVSKGFTTHDDGLNSEFVAVANVDNAVLNNGLVLPEAGTYFMRSEEKYIIELPVSTVKVEPIAYEFMPEGFPKKEFKEVTLFDQTVITDENCMYAPTDYIPLVIGNTYSVTVDGTEYECVCYSLQEAYVLGNGTIAGGSGGNNEPFVIANLPAYSATNMLFSGAASTEVAVKIVGAAEVVTPMDENMVPPMTPIYISQEEVDGTVTYKADTTFSNAYALPVGTLASRLVYGFDESWKEGGLGTSCLTVTKAATRSHGQNIVMVFSEITAMSDDTYSVEDMTFVWTADGIELLPRQT